MNKYGVEQELHNGLTIVKKATYREPGIYISGRKGIEHWLGPKKADFKYDF